MGAGQGGRKAGRGSERGTLLRGRPLMAGLFSATSLSTPVSLSHAAAGTPEWASTLPWVLGGAALLLAGAALGVAFQWRAAKRKKGSFPPEIGQQLAATCPVGILLCASGRITYANDAAAAALGYDSGERLVGSLPASWPLPDGEESITRCLEHLSAQEFTLEEEATGRLLKRDGTPVWVRVKIMPSMGPGPSAALFLEPLSAPPGSEDLSFDTQDWTSLWAEHGKDALYLHDPEGRFLRFIAPELCGIDPEAAVGRMPADLYPAPRAEAILARVREAVSTGAPVRAEYSETWRGREHFFAETGTPLRDPEGKVLAVVRYCRNITEVREAEASTRQASQDFQALLANLPGMAYRFRLTPGWPTEFASEGALALTGYPAHHFVGPRAARFQEILLPEDRERRTLALQRAVGEERPYRITYRIRTANGQLRWVLDQGRAVPARAGEAGSVEGFATDITARVSAEEALRQSEKDYRLLVEHQSEFLVKLDGQGRFLFVSPSFCEFIGRSGEELLGTELVALAPESSRAALLEAFSGLREPPCTTQVEQRIGTNHGQRWLSWSFRGLLDPGGRLAEAVAVGRDVTVQKAIAEALSESEARWRSIVEKTPLCVKLLDREGRVLQMNPAGLAMFQASAPTQVIGIRARNAVLPEDQAAFDEMVEMGFRGEERHLVFRIRGLQGGVLTLESRSVPLREGGSDSGPVQSLLGVTQDITSRLATEETLRQSEAKYRRIFEGISDGVYLTSADGKLLLANPALVKMLGYKDVRDLQSVDIATNGYADMGLRARFAELMERDGRVEAFESQWLHKDGSVVYVVENARAIRGSDGKVAFYEGTARDVTQERKAQEALLQSEARYRTLFDQASDAIFLADPESGALLDGNRRAQELIGRSLGEIRSMHQRDLHPPEEWERYAAVFQKHAEDPTGTSTSDLLVQHRDGRRIPVDISGSAFRAGGRRIQMGVFHDITERKRNEEALLRERNFSVAALDSLPALFYMLDATGNFMRWNQTLEKAGEYSSEEIARMHPLDFFEGSDKTLIAERIFQVFSRGHATAEAAFVTKSGARIPMFFSANKVRFEGQDCLIGTGIDIAERVRADNALRESERMLQESQAVAGLGSYVLDIPSGLWTCSEMLTQIFGIPSLAKHEVATWVSILHPEEREAMVDYFKTDVVGQARSFDREYRILRLGDGEERWVRGVGKLELDASGKPVKMFGTIQDITERKRAEETLRQSESRLQRILTHSPIAMALVGMDGTIEFINEKAVETFGYAHEEIPRMDNWWALAYPDESYRAQVLSTWMGLVAEAFAHDREIEGREYRVTCKDGSVKTTFIFGVPISDKVFVMFQDVTARRQAEAALQESETRYRLIAEQTGQIVYEYLPEGDRFLWSGALHATAGWREADLPRGMGEFEALLTPEDRRAVGESFVDARRSEGRFSIEHRLLRGDGSRFWADNRGVYLPPAEGGEARILGTISDVTVRHEALEEVLLVSGQLRHLLSATPTVLYTCSAQDPFPATYISANVTSVMGLRPSEFTSDPRFWASRIHPEDSPRVFADLPKLFEEGAHLHRYRFLDGKGEWRWMQDDLRLLRDDSGAPSEIAGSWTDVTDLVLAELGLRESEERFRKLFEQAQVGIAILTPEGKFQRANPAFCEMLGYSEEELRALTFPQITHPEHIQGDIEGIRMLKTGESSIYRTQKRYITKSGEPLWANLTASAMRGEDGLLKYFVSVAEDITEQRNAEEELLRQNRQLSAILASSQAMTGFIELVPTARALCQFTLEAFGLELAWIGLVVPESTELKILASAGNDRGYTDRIRVRWDESPHAQGPSGRCIKSRKPEIGLVSDASFAPWREQAEARNFRKTCAIPLIHEDTVRGTLCLYSASEDSFPPKTLETLQVFAHQCTMAIVNSALYEEAKRTVQELLDRTP